MRSIASRLTMSNIMELIISNPPCYGEKDLDHSELEKRYYCLGQIAGGIMTVRFTYRENKIRIIGAG